MGSNCASNSSPKGEVARAARRRGSTALQLLPFTGLLTETHRLGQDRRAREKGFQLALGLV